MASDATKPIAERHLGRRAAHLRVKGTEEAIDALLVSLSGGESLWQAETLARDARSFQAQMGELHDAWSMLTDAETEDEVRDTLSGLSLEGLLFAGLAATYERAEDHPPVAGFLAALRGTVDGWAHSHSGSTTFASVSFADLTMLSRRLDIAIEIVRRTFQARDERGNPAEMGGAS